MNDNGKKKYLVADIENIAPTPAPADRLEGLLSNPVMTLHPFTLWIFQQIAAHTTTRR